MNDSKDRKAAAEPPLDSNVGRCTNHCDFERAQLIRRATWICPDCKRDISIEYLYWAPVAHPEWFDRDLNDPVPNAPV